VAPRIAPLFICCCWARFTHEQQTHTRPLPDSYNGAQRSCCCSASIQLCFAACRAGGQRGPQPAAAADEDTPFAMQAATIDASADNRHPQPPITVFDDAGPLDADAAAIAAEAADDVSALPDTAARSGSSADAAAKVKGATAAPAPAAPMVNNAPSSKHKHRRKMIPLKRVRQCCWAPVMCVLALHAHGLLGCCWLECNSNSSGSRQAAALQGASSWRWAGVAVAAGGASKVHAAVSFTCMWHVGSKALLSRQQR
jgi:hypothetical protein